MITIIVIIDIKKGAPPKGAPRRVGLILTTQWLQVRLIVGAEIIIVGIAGVVDITVLGA